MWRTGCQSVGGWRLSSAGLGAGLRADCEVRYKEVRYADGGAV